MHLKFFQAFDNPDCCPISSCDTVDLREFCGCKENRCIALFGTSMSNSPLDSHFPPRSIARQLGCESGMMNLSKT